MFDAPETRYARSGGGYVAFQVWGEGAVDLVTCGGAWSIDTLWDQPRVAETLERLGRFARNIWFDVRGSGASSRVRRDVAEVAAELGIASGTTHKWLVDAGMSAPTKSNSSTT